MAYLRYLVLDYLKYLSMRAFLYLLISTTILLSTACERVVSNREKFAKIDEELISEYLDENNIDALRHESGLYYNILNEGDQDGERPNSFSQVQVSYEGYFLDGTVFDSADSTNLAEIDLDETVPGWRIGLPYIREGGSIQLFIPSRLGYGRRARGSIPPNTVLLFDINLHRVR